MTPSGFRDGVLTDHGGRTMLYPESAHQNQVRHY